MPIAQNLQAAASGGTGHGIDHGTVALRVDHRPVLLGTSLASWLWSLAANAGATKLRARDWRLRIVSWGVLLNVHPPSMKIKWIFNRGNTAESSDNCDGRVQDLHDLFRPLCSRVGH